MTVRFRDAVAADGPALAAVGRRCFDETFGPHFDPADMAAHLDESFGPDGLLADLARPDCRIRIAEEEGAIAAYLKLMPMSLPVDHAPGALEIKQLYVLEPWQGAGVAQALMDWAVATARADGAPALYLSVWEEGHRARAFYRRHGFVAAGHAPFRLGSHVCDDPVLKLDLAA
ncbi:GNAT family N-acetyltransferase [Allosphingosinicella indica]|uniref:Ribosomal protein S18 acetylase RimI n=1 Tax=Allosphingosinicella indica TaxID=941907 RepID=A0A1X7G8P1_9SPHN|nr:GNAT family N-acetyltransferase [Allosphingosinicella indica]SMF65420.1 Ribosomal protein S18 acetylase RimI [Allosphingosinicella indica]